MWGHFPGYKSLIGIRAKWPGRRASLNIYNANINLVHVVNIPIDFGERLCDN